jgi:hypothetical protein
MGISEQLNYALTVSFRTSTPGRNAHLLQCFVMSPKFSALQPLLLKLRARLGLLRARRRQRPLPVHLQCFAMSPKFSALQPLLLKLRARLGLLRARRRQRPLLVHLQCFATKMTIHQPAWPNLQVLLQRLRKI